MVKRTKNHPFRRQAAFFPGRHAFGYFYAVIGGQIGIRQIDYFFVVVLLLVFRDHLPVGDNIIHIIYAHGAGIAQIIDLYGNWAVGKNFAAGI